MELDQTIVPVKVTSEPERIFRGRTDRLTRIIRELETLSAEVNTQPGQRHIEQALSHLVDAKLVEGMTHYSGTPVLDVQQ